VKFEIDRIMSRLVITFFIAFLAVEVYAQKSTGNLQDKNDGTSKSSEKPDTIVKLGGKKILCSVGKVTATSVFFCKIGQTTEEVLSRKEIEKVIYRTGRKEVYNKPVLQMIDKDQWEAVLITENKNDVEGLYKKGVIKANAASGSTSLEAAKTSARIRLQKKAASMGALIVLVVHSEMKGGYGEIPGWLYEGIAYSDSPPVDTASVNKAVRELIEGKTKPNKGK
jgi:hypothetical protein